MLNAPNGHFCTVATICAVGLFFNCIQGWLCGLNIVGKYFTQKPLFRHYCKATAFYLLENPNPIRFTLGKPDKNKAAYATTCETLVDYGCEKQENRLLLI
jgi:hypothetical protein